MVHAAGVASCAVSDYMTDETDDVYAENVEYYHKRQTVTADVAAASTKTFKTSVYIVIGTPSRCCEVAPGCFARSKQHCR